MSTTVRATAAIGRVESWRLLRNPLVWLSLLPTLQWVRTSRGVDSAEDQLLLLTGYGLVFTALVITSSTVLASLRDRLERTGELLGTAPLPIASRSIGLAMSGLAAGAVATVTTVVLLLVLRPASPLGPWDPSDGVALDIPRPNPAQLVQGPLALLVMVTMAVAIVRWIPTWLVLVPIVLFLTMIQGLFVGIFHGVPADGGRWFFPLNTGVVNGPWSGCGPQDATCTLAVAGFDRTTPWWHAAFLLACATWFTSLAVLRHRRDRPAWAAAVATTAVLVATAAIQFTVAERFPGA